MTYAYSSHDWKVDEVFIKFKSDFAVHTRTLGTGLPNFGRSVNLFQLGGADYAYHITNTSPRFSDLPNALHTSIRYTL